MKQLSLLLVSATLLLAPSAHAYTFLQTRNCPGDMGAAWPSHLLPSAWHLHEGGYSRIKQENLLTVIQHSVDAWGGQWGTPCCSAFSNSYEGTTSYTGLDRSELNVVSFEEDVWPNWLGSPSSVIAVTLPGLDWNGCELASADMVFNGVGFDFRVDGVFDFQRDVDLESIAVHEFGHWIGLDHSQNPNVRGGYEPASVMFPAYRGGVGDRSLYEDDQLASCALYPSSCGACTADRDCPDGMECDGKGNCTQIACGSNRDCPKGSVCEDGSCWRGCRNHTECNEDETCNNGACTLKVPCATCNTCRRSTQCGPTSDYHCIALDESGMRRCTKVCNTDFDCDGDSVCRTVDANGTRICGSPGGAELCPAGFQCATQACPSLGQSCTGADGCGGLSDTCVVSAERTSVCSCTCNSDADCGGGSCLQDPLTGLPSCYPAGSPVEKCGDTTCPFGASCIDGACSAICGSTHCAPDEACEKGSCVALCPTCLPGEVCHAGSRTCRPDESCQDVFCASGQLCVEGGCVPLCGGKTICDEGTSCQGGVCKAPANSKGGCSASGGDLSIWAAIWAFASLCALRSRRATR